MRKVFSIFALAMLLLATTACGDDKNDDIVYQLQGQFVNNTVRLSTNQSVSMSSSLTNITWNVRASTMTLNYSVPIEGGSTATLNITDVPMTPNSSLGCYTFETPNGGTGITAVKGYFAESGSFLLEFTYNGTHRVISAAQLFFPYVKCTVSNTEDTTKPDKVNDKAAMLININTNTKKADVTIANFALEADGGVISTVNFLGLDVVATSDGYKVTTSSTVNSVDGLYTLSDFEANVTNACHAVNGTFKVNSKFAATFTGTAFNQ